MIAGRVPLISDSLREAADSLAIEADGAWFGIRRWRRFRVRQSYPRELSRWGALTHLQQNWILVRVSRSRKGSFTAYERIGVAFQGEFPDEENFLERLWAHYEAIKIKGDGIHYLSAEEIKNLFADLLKR